MRNKYTVTFIIALALILSILGFRDILFKSKAQRLFLTSWNELKTEYYDKTLNHQDWNKWRDKYIDQIHTEEDAYVAIDSIIESLNDPYTRFLRPEEFEEQNIGINAKLFGIGVNISEINGKTIVVSVLEGSPAQKAGIKAGDILTKVNDTEIKGFKINDVAKLVRGPADSKVQLKIIRDKTAIVYNIKREEIKIKTVKLNVTDNIAHITISSFLSQDTPVEVQQALEKSQKTKGIILDLRGNTGGLLPNAVIIANMFIPSGNIVSIVDRNGKSTKIEAITNYDYIQKPLVILINEGSASASEILSGALKDYNRAILVGEKSFGKGLVQKIETIQKNNGLNITIAKYLTPSGTDINKKGIEPDFKVEYTKEDFLKHKDPQLDKAKEIINTYKKITAEAENQPIEYTTNK
ncbi:MAG: S41 family peptidase [Candidatus Gastranaerophilales bacterium]|nr:S41 family peptidase [Candidatus Gastranaerophilales bacterium]